MLTTIIVGVAVAVICLEFYTVFRVKADEKIWKRLKEEHHE